MDLQYIESLAPGSGNRVRPRSYLDSTAEVLSLNGTWQFHYVTSPLDAPADAAAPDFDDAGWDQIPVPSHWVLQGDGKYGRPAYTNVQFPFPLDPPHVPDANPTGDYRRTFELSEEFLAGRVYLRLLGVESLAVVSINGTHVGEVRGSRLAQELDVTEQLRTGENLIHIRVHQWSAHTYVEDQDQWWLPGIFRDVDLVARPDQGIEDVWLDADFDPATGEGSIRPELRGSFPIIVRIPELGVEHSFASAQEVASFQVGAVEPWSADVPRLYDAEVSNQAETLSLRLGFRRVEIVGHEWRVNGRKLRLRGVNRHDFHPDLGRVYEPEDVRRGLLLMKQNNINAIRTSHYPPHPDLLKLTDELGFWVIDENDLETHGFELDEWYKNPSDEAEWLPALLDRIERFFERDKNHPSVICWSLGNEAGTGQNLAAMSAWLHRRDSARPVHYESDFDFQYTDIVSRMYSEPDHMKDMSAGVGENRWGDPRRAPEVAKHPMILCEYVHAMGNGAGDIDYYEEHFDTLPQWHGGFVWEWRDHGIRTKTPQGQTYFAFGGDFGEQVHDRNFVCDGMLLPDGTPTPMLAELAAVITPIKLQLSEAEVIIENRRHDGDTSDLAFVVVDEIDGKPVAEHRLEVPPVAAGEAATVALPEAPALKSGELWRTVRAELGQDAPWAEAGHVVTVEQIRLGVVGERLGLPNPSVQVTEDAGVLRLGDGEFDPRTGDLLRWQGKDVLGPQLDLWRAPTDNDKRLAAVEWRKKRLDQVQRRVVSVEAAGNVLRVQHSYAPPVIAGRVLVDLEWSVVGDELMLRADARPNKRWPDLTWPRLGLRWRLPKEIDQVEWFGTGPLENYSDSFRAARVSRFSCTIDDLVVRYSMPQESGHRAGLRELTLPELGLRLRADELGEERPGFVIRRHTQQQVDLAQHPHALPQPTATYLWLDAAQHGLGSRACGPDVRDVNALRPRAASWQIRLGSVGQES